MNKVTKAELREEVERLNRKYCKNSKHKLHLQGGYGGVQVQLTGKTYKKGNRTHYRGSLASGNTEITAGFHSPTETLFRLYKADSKGEIKKKVKHWDSIPSKR